MRTVSEEEFYEFLKNYPNKLERDWFMDWFSYNDFTRHGGCKWPESIVAMKSDGSYGEPIEYKINEDWE